VTDDTSETHFEPSTASRLQYSQQASRSDADTSSITTETPVQRNSKDCSRWSKHRRLSQATHGYRMAEDTCADTSHRLGERRDACLCKHSMAPTSRYDTNEKISRDMISEQTQVPITDAVTCCNNLRLPAYQPAVVQGNNVADSDDLFGRGWCYLYQRI
jgi:hypothetical protein